MSKKDVLPLPPAYSELSNLLFKLQMSYIDSLFVDVEELKCKVDSMIAYIHANNIIENQLKFNSKD